ncbi:N-acetylmuramoyl-L-alanine amidase family protein [Pontiella sulfatireligans]|uniref:N-acetylmuramoyl-L-alanine amidase n=1 Tax=Pontiella sulfatireligans TaxID=2750658 RepID=A0A6C2UUJ4_9BACT|nr:N-acetylmuramoyl-L-alanine amidase [Pontiella sulfatireligans]VGO22844.1 N-acetylmuramoyl-L-alanine amidase AmiA [Pontiella sulfatireligans]
MHPITRKLFLSNVVLLAGCRSATVEARSSSPTGIVSLSYVARLYSMSMASVGKKMMLQNKWNKIEVETNSRRAWINGIMVWLHHPCRKSGSGWGIREVDFKKGIDPIMRSYAYVPSKTPRVVVLDPGHGGKDSGAIGARKVYEKKAVLSISSRVKAHLEAKKITVRMTRTGDTLPSLQQRVDYASRAGADLFVSIHADGAGDSSAHGVETFVPTAPGCDSSNHYGQAGDKSAFPGNLFDAANAVLGFSIQSNLIKKSKRSDRGLRRARFFVIKNAPCPAALVECGFVTNPAEEALLISAEYREAVARGISNGILGYMTLVKRAQK